MQWFLGSFLYLRVVDLRDHAGWAAKYHRELDDVGYIVLPALERG